LPHIEKYIFTRVWVWERYGINITKISASETESDSDHLLSEYPVREGIVFDRSLADDDMFISEIFCIIQEIEG
jgi:hypothetical protein